MAITYTWAVQQMDAHPTYEGHTNVVSNVHWTLAGVDGEHTAGVYGSVGLTLDPDATYAPYGGLTEAKVIGWVKDALGKEQVKAYEANVAAQIEAQINPPVVTPDLPWAE